MSDTHTWADGFGRWHASVPLTGNDQADADSARALIVDELAQREGSHFDPARITVTRTSVTNHGTAVYSEVIDDGDDPMWCTYCDGAVISNPDGPGYVHAEDGDRVRVGGPGDLVSAAHNRAGTRVNPVDITETRPV